MFLKKVRISLTKKILPLIYKFVQILKSNTRTINYLNDKRIDVIKTYDFRKSIKELIGDKKLVGLDVGAQGGFNSDKFFPEKYEDYFEIVEVDPLIKSSSKNKKKSIINKGLWSSKGQRKLYVLENRPESSSMFEPDKDSLEIYDFKEKDFSLFNVSKTEMIECDTLSNSLKELKINNLDYLKIDTQGAELEILKGMGAFRPLMIKCEIRIFPMYKNEPRWTVIIDYLYSLGYILCEWRNIGSHSTRSPVEMDMVFIPNFSNDLGKSLIRTKQDYFISLMLITGQIKILKKIAKILKLQHTEIYMGIEDKYFN
tara:strand:- start:96 stop:1034 length:939 start_codon:yes stop_codon:yes gene_type:complete